MTLHKTELSGLGAERNQLATGNPRPDLTVRFGVRRSEVVLPSSSSLASVLVLGIFALSLAGAGLGYQLTRWRKR